MAEQVPGVARFVSAADLKTIKASNDIGTTGYTIFAVDKVSFYGQFVGLILADVQSTAERARKLVVVNYAQVGYHTYALLSLSFK